MRTNYILIDFENVQPKTLTELSDYTFKVLVFVGANQTKVQLELVQTLQPLGAAAEYIQVSGTGPNALDFHIAYYLGELCKLEPEGLFHIISKDKGFDPLVEHLRERKIRISRSVDISELPMFRISNATNSEEEIKAVVQKLVGRGTSRPRKESTLLNTVRAMLAKDRDIREIEGLIGELKRRKLVIVTDGKVSYNLVAAETPPCQTAPRPPH